MNIPLSISSVAGDPRFANRIRGMFASADASRRRFLEGASTAAPSRRDGTSGHDDADVSTAEQTESRERA